MQCALQKHSTVCCSLLLPYPPCLLLPYPPNLAGLAGEFCIVPDEAAAGGFRLIIDNNSGT